MQFNQRALISFLLGLCVSVVVYWGSASVRKAFLSPEQSESSGVYSTLTQERDWLNVSRPFNVKDLQNRIILLDFWTYCCINCMHVLPQLHELEKEFGSSLLVIGVHSGKFDQEKNTGAIRSAVLRYEIEHPVVNDSNFRVWNSFAVKAWPTLILINPLGEVEQVYSGEGHTEDLRREISSIIQKFSRSLNTSPLPIVLEKSHEADTVLRFPGKLTYDSDRKWIWISDSQNHRLVSVDLKGQLQRVIESNDPTIRLNRPQGLIYRDHQLYVADTEDHRIKRVDLKTERIEVIAGNGAQGVPLESQGVDALKTPLSSPWDLAFLAGHPNSIVIAMAGVHQLWVLDLSKGTLDVIAGNGREFIDDGVFPYSSLSQPSGLSSYGTKTYFVDAETSSLRVLEMAQVTTLLGQGLFDFGLIDGNSHQARLQHPLGVWADASGVYIADTYNHSIRVYDPKAKVLRTLTGSVQPGYKDGSFAEARFNEPSGLIKVGQQIFVTDTNNHRIRVLDLQQKKVRTLELRGLGGSREAKEAKEQENSSVPEKRKKREFSSALPRLQYRGSLKFNFHSRASVSLEFKSDWKLNGQAPSWIAIFESQDGQSFSLVHEYLAKDLQSHELRIPELDERKKYRLQGTLYSCRKGQESLCTLQSLDYDLESDSQAMKRELKIHLDHE